jgi:hypothetical protein
MFFLPRICEHCLNPSCRPIARLEYGECTAAAAGLAVGPPGEDGAGSVLASA